MPVDGGDDERRDVVAGAPLVDIGSRVEERLYGFELPLAGGKVQRRQAALRGNEL